MSGAVEIYNLKHVMEGQLRKLRKDLNGEVLEKYYQARIAEGISLARTVKCSVTLRRVSKLLGKRFEDATTEDIASLVRRIDQLSVSVYTKRDFKIILKKFYQWLSGKDGEFPPEVKWIRCGRRPQNRLTKGQLLTREDSESLLKSANNIRDKALLSVIMESGRRIGDILPLKIADIDFDDMGARLLVDGKSGVDYSRIISSAPALAMWLDNHPSRENPKSPVWVNLESKNKGKQLSYHAAARMLKKCVKRGGLNKRIYFHLFRHTRATQAATKLNQIQLCALLGWKFSSNMPSTYVHLAGEDIDEAQAIMNGVERAKQEASDPQPKTCSRCGLKNTPFSKFCTRCGFVLDAETALEIDQARTKTDELMKMLTQDPKKLEKLLALVDAS